MVIRLSCAIHRHQQKMKLLLTFIFCWTIILVSGADQLPKGPIEKNASGIGAPIEPTVVPSTTTTTTTLPPAPETTTTASNITTAPPKTTTIAPNTTTSAPNTTTSAPNTTTSAPNTTTVAPNTTTVAPKTTTVAPKTTTVAPKTTTVAPKTTIPTPTPAPPTPTPPPTPKPEIGQWTVNSTNYTCIVLRMAAQFNITYITNDNKTMSKQMILPSSNLTTATGTCGDPEQIIEISWKNSTVPMTNNDSLIFHFIKNKTQSMYSLHYIEFKIATEELPRFNSSAPLVLIHNASEYQIPLINSYRCLKSQKISLSSAMRNTTGILDITDLQFQAFKNEKNSGFSNPEDCPYDTPDYVPIAVGCGLIILVVVVLVAYLVGRRRSQSRGYLSM